MKLLPESKYVFQYQEQVSKTITSKAANIIDYLCKYMCVYIYVYTHTHTLYMRRRKWHFLWETLASYGGLAVAVCTVLQLPSQQAEIHRMAMRKGKQSIRNGIHHVEY